MDSIGYFSSPSDKKPVYDPGLDVDCLVCGLPLSSPLLVHSFMGADGLKSYFYRTHKGCDPSQIEGKLVDEVLGK